MAFLRLLTHRMVKVKKKGVVGCSIRYNSGVVECGVLELVIRNLELVAGNLELGLKFAGSFELGRLRLYVFR